MDVLTHEQLSQEIGGLGNGWEERGGTLHKEFRFEDFAAAMAFANRIADAAEAEDHHPDMLVAWGKVELWWVNHSAGGITAKDVEMARRSDEAQPST